jgi:hypothetical protein
MSNCGFNVDADIDHCFAIFVAYGVALRLTAPVNLALGIKNYLT